ncbi:hypothetical protein, partial [Phyllobacterium leguminum]
PHIGTPPVDGNGRPAIEGPNRTHPHIGNPPVDGNGRPAIEGPNRTHPHIGSGVTGGNSSIGEGVTVSGGSIAGASTHGSMGRSSGGSKR